MSENILELSRTASPRQAFALVASTRFGIENHNLVGCLEQINYFPVPVITLIGEEWTARLSFMGVKLTTGEDIALSKKLLRGHACERIRS
jgi:hypothetical protein